MRQRVAVAVIIMLALMIMNTFFLVDGRHLKLQDEEEEKNPIENQKLTGRKQYETSEYNHHGCYRSDYNCWSNKETKE